MYADEQPLPEDDHSDDHSDDPCDDHDPKALPGR
jgi:hypothetical protein